MAAVRKLDEQPDFVFGPLSSEPQRIEYVRAARAGITYLRTPRDPRPGEEVTIEIAAGPGADEPELRVDGEAVPLAAIEPEWDTLVWGYVRRYRATIPGRPAGTIVRYAIGGDDEHAYYVDDDPPPAWARDAVVYQVFVDRFDPGEGRTWAKEPFMGGTLAGVTRRLDHVAELGANVLWLSPIFPSPTYHGYDATDLFDVEPRLGTKDDVRRLLDEAHARGIRVLLDFIPNHWSNRHPTFVDATTNEASPYRSWYRFERWPDRYEMFFTARSMPKVNLLDRGAREHMLDAAVHWLELGVDGFRVDHAVGPAQSFWADFRRATRAARPDCWTFGETVETPAREREFEGLLDGSLDFMLLEAFRKTFAERTWDGVRFWRFLDAHSRYFAPEFVRPSFLDNHDMNRFLWVAGGDKRRLRLAALCQFTLEGPPVVYYGTEIGMSQRRDVRQTSDREARQPMAWDDRDEELLAFYRRLVRMRRAHSWTQPREAIRIEPEALSYRVGDVSVTLDLAAGEGTIATDGEEDPWRP